MQSNHVRALVDCRLDWNAQDSRPSLVDNHSHACATRRLNRPTWNTIEAALRMIDLSPWRDVDLLSGGLRCPPYSAAGQQRGEEDEGDLFPRMLEIVRQVRPRAVPVENVRGLLHSKFADVRSRIADDLLAQGVCSNWAMLNAADHATPQNRYRLFLIGLRHDVRRELIWPFPRGGAPITVGASIGDLMGAN